MNLTVTIPESETPPITLTIGAGGGSETAAELSYDPTDSGLAAMDVQAAIDEIADSIPTSLTPDAHASTHAIGGSDPLTPSDIGAAAASTVENLTLAPETSPGAGDAGYITTSNGGSITTGNGGSIYTGNGGYIFTGTNAPITTGNDAPITTGTNAPITTSESGYISTEIDGYISTEIGGRITTGYYAHITTSENGYISTGNDGYITTEAGGSLATGTVHLTGPSTVGLANGTIMVAENNLSDLSNASTARTNLGLGSSNDVNFRKLTFGADSAQLTTLSDGVVVLSNAAGTGFSRLVLGQATTGWAAIRVTGAAVEFVTGSASTFVGLACSTVTANGLITSTTSGIASNVNVAGTTGAQVAGNFSATTNGTAAATFGARIRLQAESASGTTRDAGAIDAVWTTATDASRTSDIVFSTVTNAAALTEVMRLRNDGALIQRPPASVTPANNGDLVLEATSNTSVTIKLKGSDGVVRSVALTLA